MVPGGRRLCKSDASLYSPAVMTASASSHRVSMHTPSARAAAWADMFFVDHGFIRGIYRNRHWISPNMVRSAQPAPGDIAWAARQGIRTVLNLRGARDCGSYLLERAACRSHGLVLIDFPANSRDMPKKEMLRALPALFDGMAYPALMHCKSGADRAGLMAALFLFLHESQPLETAVRQLSLRYGHVKQAKTGMLDYFFAAYAAARAETGIAFFDWVERDYNPAALKASFSSNRIANLFVNRVLGRE